MNQTGTWSSAVRHRRHAANSGDPARSGWVGTRWILSRGGQRSGASAAAAVGAAAYARAVAANTDATPAPDAFRRAVAGLLSAAWRPELLVEEIPAPQRIAPFSAAITADVLVGGEEVGSGRLVLLHDPAGNAAWQGTFRCVTFARADVDPEMVTDPLLARSAGPG